MSDSLEALGQWADFFPMIDAFPTQDPRIFQTKWEKKDGQRTKKYFACVVGGTCYGVDVIAPKGINTKNECIEAFVKVKKAVHNYEDTGTWPQ